MTIRQIVSEIDQLLQGRFPELGKSMNAPASEVEIKAFEEKIGWSLPEDLREFYRIHNGESEEVGFFFGLPFLSLTGAAFEWEAWASIADEGESGLDTNVSSVPDQHIKENYANRNYIPISKDFGGNNLGVDLDPGPLGKRGQVINFGRDEEMRFVIAESLTEFLEFILAQLKAKNFKIVRIDEDIHWYLSEPANEHFLATLQQLDLPMGKAAAGLNSGKKDFKSWFETLDDIWKKVIENQVHGKPSFESIEKTRRLLLFDKGITDESLRTIVNFTGLKEAILTGNPISNITPLFELENLKKLYLASTYVKNVDQIKKLEALRQLSLYHVKLDSLAGISEMKKLKDLGLSNTGLKSLEEVSLVQSLSVLNISNNRFESFEPLGKLKNLTDLDISTTNLESISFMSDLNKLKSLTLYEVSVSDFTPLLGLEKLMYLTTSFSDFQKISAMFDRKLSFAICGEMTEKEDQIYSDYQLG